MSATAASPSPEWFGKRANLQGLVSASAPLADSCGKVERRKGFACAEHGILWQDNMVQAIMFGRVHHVASHSKLCLQARRPESVL